MRSVLGIGVALLVLAAACSSAEDDGTAATTGSSTSESTSPPPSTAAGTAPPATATTTTTAPTGGADGCAHVIDADIEPTQGTYRVAATIRSADTGWEKYADAFEVRGRDGTVYGTRVLAHPHVDEQPFTRSLSGVEIPDGTNEVTIAARDSVAGFCGDVVTLPVPGG